MAGKQMDLRFGDFKCPRCGRQNNDNWPLDIDGERVMGGCDECWYKECDEQWERFKDVY